MKVLKDIQHSLLFKPFGLKNKHWLSLAVMLYFDLDEPDSVLTEQQMWQELSQVLPNDLPLDIGMPKARGEVLVHGTCHAPGGEPVQGLSVAVRAGRLHKRLMVFGDRRWERGNITKPEPFTSLELTYEHAFGGKEFERNPKGKGIGPVLLPNGERIHPLPNIEDPDHLVLEATDRPEPAGYHPLEITSPQRRKKEGTFDKKWIDEVKPDLPLDTAEDMFNAAPENQQIKEFFSPGDELAVQNMHPEFSIIRSHLPLVRLRFFVTKKTGKRTGPDENEVFVEVANSIDTVWLFPALKRGVVLYRGITEVRDDEFSDLSNIFIASEESGEKEKELAYYLEEKRKRLDRKVPMDAAPLEQVDHRIASVAKKLKSIEKEIEVTKNRALGKAPLYKLTPAEKGAHKDGMLAGKFALLDKMEGRVREKMARHGGWVQFDLSRFDTIREKMLQASGNADAALQTAEKLKAQKQQSVGALSKRLKENIPADKLAEQGIDPDNPLNEQTVNPWHDHGFPLVTRWRFNLHQDRQTVDGLRKLGFFPRTLKRVWIGQNGESIDDNLLAWGFSQDEPFTLPAGLVLPRFDEAVLTGILIRPGEITDPSRDFVVPGSDPAPLAYVREGNRAVVLVDDSFAAVFMEQETGDFADVLVVASPDKPLEKKAVQVIDAAEEVVLALPEKEACGPELLSAWRTLLPDAVQHHLPIGKNLYEAFQQGVDIREWILEAVSEPVRTENSFRVPQKEGEPPKKGLRAFKLPKLNAAAIVAQFSGEIKAAKQPLKDKMNSAMSEIRAKAQSHPHFKGFAVPAETPQERAELVQSNMDKEIKAKRKQLQALGQLTPEIEAKLTEAAQDIRGMTQAYGTKLSEGMAKAASAVRTAKKAKEDIASGKLPEKFALKFGNMQSKLDQRRRLTREDVVLRLERGESLAGSILSGLDLSGLDFSGRDLSEVTCVGTIFHEADLRSCNLTRINAKEADFSRAVLKEAEFNKALCNKSLFVSADLSGASVHQSVFRGADMTGVNLSGARLNMTTLEKVKLQQAVCTGLSLTLAAMSGTDAVNCSFAEASFRKCLFQKNSLHNADFSRASLTSCMFQKVSGEKMVFTASRMHKCGFVLSELPNADFSGTTISQSMFKESDLRKACFDTSVLDGSQFDTTDLFEASFYKTQAKRCRFPKSDLRGANCKAANLCFSSLRKAHLGTANFMGANLYGVDFFKAQVSETIFELANLRKTLLENRTDLL